MADRRPNVVLVLADDHAAHAIGAYGSRVNATPAIDRLAAEGLRFDAAFCTNSICSPSRASILTGTYSHVNGVTTLDTPFDARQPTFPALLQAAGYQTALFGKWHLGHGGIHDPTGFDAWSVLPEQGDYLDPTFLDAGGRTVVRPGYATDLITDLACDWIAARDRDRPFLTLVHHKAPHRPWEPAARHATAYDDAAIPEPPTLRDDLSRRSPAAREARMHLRDLTEDDLRRPVPAGLDADDDLSWRYQRYMAAYLGCIAAVDESVERLLDVLDGEGLAETTFVAYTSDQGFFLGDHGWFDKRLMYEESLRMPLLVRYLAGVEPTWPIQGTSLRPLFAGRTPDAWRRSMYYRYWMHLDGAHNVWAHRGVRTERHKLIHWYGQALGQPGARDEPRPEAWELFDLEADPLELNDLHADPSHAGLVAELRDELERLGRDLGDVAPADDPRWRNEVSR